MSLPRWSCLTWCPFPKVVLLLGDPPRAGILLFLHAQACLQRGSPVHQGGGQTPSLPGQHRCVAIAHRNSSTQVHMELPFHTSTPPTIFSLPLPKLDPAQLPSFTQLKAAGCDAVPTASIVLSSAETATLPLREMWKDWGETLRKITQSATSCEAAYFPPLML